MIQVIQRALDILEYIANEPDKPKPLGEIASKLELNAGTCANIIKTLVERKYLEKIDKQKGYCLGSMAYRISGNEGYQKGLVDAAKEEMEALTKKINENSLLAILNGVTRIAILRAHGANDLQATTPAEKLAYETTSGRLLIAMLPDAELEKYISKYGLPKADVWPEACNVKSFQRQIKKIQNEQYAVQVTKGQIVGLAAPVYKKEKVVASLGVYMPVFRYSKWNKNEIVKYIKSAAEKISRKLT